MTQDTNLIWYAKMLVCMTLQFAQDRTLHSQHTASRLGSEINYSLNHSDPHASEAQEQEQEYTNEEEEEEEEKEN